MCYRLPPCPRVTWPHVSCCQSPLVAPPKRSLSPCRLARLHPEAAEAPFALPPSARPSPAGLSACPCFACWDRWYGLLHAMTAAAATIPEYSSFASQQLLAGPQMRELLSGRSSSWKIRDAACSASCSLRRGFQRLHPSRQSPVAVAWALQPSSVASASLVPPALA